MFIGRKKELQSLEELYQKDESSLAILYGRRRVGKTRLIQEFTRNKKTIFFSSQEGDEQSNLKEPYFCCFSAKITRNTHMPLSKIYGKIPCFETLCHS